MVHGRFSTNTFPSWERAHPNRFVSSTLFCQNFLKFIFKIAIYKLIHYTLTSVYKVVILFSIHFFWYMQGELSNNQELVEFAIVYFILMTLVFDSGVMLITLRGSRDNEIYSCASGKCYGCCICSGGTAVMIMMMK